MRTIYLDYNATTPISPHVQQAMLPFLAEHYGNPSSDHLLGRAAREAVEDARGNVAGLLGCRRDEVVFTSCGTESNNLAIKGVCLNRRFADPSFAGRGHLIISSIEHPATVAPARFLEKLGFRLTIVGVNGQGLIDPAEIQQAIEPDTLLVSVMHANNEVGTIEPIREIADLCHARGVPVHTDAAQSSGKIEIDVDALGVELLSITGHKVYAPKGVGALYVRRGTALEPAIHGAPHEGGLRAGTENVPYLVGLGAAAAVAAKHVAEAGERALAMRERLRGQLESEIEGLSVNGDGAPRLPNTLNANFPGVLGGELLARIPELCASTGAACHSGDTQLSSTLKAMGVEPDVSCGSVRLSCGWHTDEDEIDRAASLLISAWQSLLTD